MAGPLAGYRVLDLSRVLAAPWAGQTLADLGAEVIKVERPGSGDETRAWGPPFLRDANGQSTAEAAYFLSANRGKKSVALDISTADGQRLVRELAAKSDALLENYKVGGLRKYGLDYAAVREINPRLVYCSITGFGQDGPYAEKAGYDFVIQGLGGFMSINGDPDGMPTKAGVATADLFTGMYAAVAVVSALLARERGAPGQHIDMALLDSQVAMLANQASNFHVSGSPPGRAGNAHPNIVPYQVVPTADGHIILAVGNDRQFQAFCTVAGQPQLAHDPSYATNRMRVANRDALMAIICELTRTRPSGDWLSALEAANVPCGAVNDIAAVFADPQVRHRGMRIELDHPLAGTVPLTASPLRFSATPVEYRRAPPLLGQHTRDVLCGMLGYSGAQVDDWIGRGICAEYAGEA